MTQALKRKQVRAELESPAEKRHLGTGWVSGVTALVTSVAGLCFVLCLPLLLLLGKRHPRRISRPGKPTAQRATSPPMASAVVGEAEEVVTTQDTR